MAERGLHGNVELCTSQADKFASSRETMVHARCRYNAAITATDTHMP